MKRFLNASAKRQIRPAAVRSRKVRRSERSGLPIIGGVLVVLVLTAGVYARPSRTRTLQGAVANEHSAKSRQVVASSADFQPHACLTFGPLHGNLHRVVFVDPGHGGLDPGGTGTTTHEQTIYEKDLTLAVALDLSTLLRDAGYIVVLSRDSDTLVTRMLPGDVSANVLNVAGEHRDIVARAARANAAHAQVLLAIHFDAFSDPAVNGAETLYDSARTFAAANVRLALLAQTAVIARLRANGWAVPDRVVVDDSAAGTPALSAEGTAYGHLLELGPVAAGWLSVPSTMPGISAEPLFLTHPAGADVAVSTQDQHAIAAGLTQAIGTYFATTSMGAA